MPDVQQQNCPHCRHRAGFSTAGVERRALHMVSLCPSLGWAEKCDVWGTGIMLKLPGHACCVLQVTEGNKAPNAAA
jgi:hypothetical protein